VRRIILTIASTAAALVLLFSYRTSTGSGDVAAKTIVSSAAGVVSGAAVPAAQAPSAAATPQGAAVKVINGSTVQTEYGPVQVQITVAGGKITAADAVQYPTAQRRDVQINRQAVPMLNAEVLAAQSANIDAVSGASYTSDGYIQSLQAALDLAHQ